MPLPRQRCFSPQKRLLLKFLRKKLLPPEVVVCPGAWGTWIRRSPPGVLSFGTPAFFLKSPQPSALRLRKIPQEQTPCELAKSFKRNSPHTTRLSAGRVATIDTCLKVAWRLLFLCWGYFSRLLYSQLLNPAPMGLMRPALHIRKYTIKRSRKHKQKRGRRNRSRRQFVQKVHPSDPFPV